MSDDKYYEVQEEQKDGFVIRDRRGVEAKNPPCRTCGSPVEHTQLYNQPTPECIKYLREEITRLKERVNDLLK